MQYVGWLVQLKAGEGPRVHTHPPQSTLCTLPPSCATTAEALAFCSCTRSASAFTAKRLPVYSTPSSPVGFSSPYMSCVLFSVMHV